MILDKNYQDSGTGKFVLFVCFLFCFLVVVCRCLLLLFVSFVCLLFTIFVSLGVFWGVFVGLVFVGFLFGWFLKEMNYLLMSKLSVFKVRSAFSSWYRLHPNSLTGP